MRQARDGCQAAAVDPTDGGGEIKTPAASSSSCLQIVFLDPQTRQLRMRGYDDTLAIASDAGSGKK